MKIKKGAVFFLLIFFLISHMDIAGFAAEPAGIAVDVSPEIVEAGETVTVTVSLTGYDENAIPIRGIQIDVDDVNESILMLEESSYESLIEDETAAANSAGYLQNLRIIRFLYAQISKTLPQPYEEIFRMTLRVNSELTEEGSLAMPLVAKMATTESDVTINDEVVISYVPADKTPDPDVVSVDIEWGAMDYIYTDGDWNTSTHSYENGGWDDGGSGYVRISNTGSIDTTAEFSFIPESDWISGSFTDGVNAITDPVNIAAGGSQKAYLQLSGKPSDELENEKIGSVTVKIGGE